MGDKKIFILTPILASDISNISSETSCRFMLHDLVNGASTVHQLMMINQHWLQLWQQGITLTNDDPFLWFKMHEFMDWSVFLCVSMSSPHLVFVCRIAETPGSRQIWRPEKCSRSRSWKNAERVPHRLGSDSSCSLCNTLRWLCSVWNIIKYVWTGPHKMDTTARASYTKVVDLSWGHEK